MKKRILVSILALFILLLSLTGCDILFELGGFGDYDDNDGNGYLDDFDEPHDCIFTEWEVIYEPTCLGEGEEVAYCDICYEESYRSIPKAEHTIVEHEEVPASCTESGMTAGSDCSLCGEVISGLEYIDAKGHNEVIDAAVPVTETTVGRTEGSHCSECGEVFIRQTSIFPNNYANTDMYHDDYAYESLSAHENGSEMQAFYREIDEVASAFHNSLDDAQMKENAGNITYYVAEIIYSDNDISSDEAFAAWSAYIKDHPLYYWISYKATYTDSYLSLAVDPEYVDGDVREQINSDIYNKVESYLDVVKGYVDPYNITLGLHDTIILNADYAYMSDGKTPSTENSAHNITGVLLEGEGVCESYTKTFQLLLNYIGIENIYVIGDANGAHAWNLVQLDDGEWYWYDLTWDDRPNRYLGVSHNYFCVSNDDGVAWSSTLGVYTKFLSDHTPDQPGELGVNYTYPLPAVANDAYEYDGFKVYEDTIMSDNNLTYAIIGFNTVSLIKIEREGVIEIPETVRANGIDYTVAAIGQIDLEGKHFTYATITDYDFVFNKEKYKITEIRIPKTVVFIMDYVFDNCESLEAFYVDPQSSEFLSSYGVLFTKSFYTLIKYPLAKSGEEYTVPSLTEEIAYNAFGTSGFRPKHLEKLTIFNTTEIIGSYGSYIGYRNEWYKDLPDTIINSEYQTVLYMIFGDGLIRKDLE